MSETEQSYGERNGAVIGSVVIVLSLVVGLWIFLALPMPWTHTEAGMTFTGECYTGGGVAWSPEPPSDANGRSLAADYCSTWSATVNVISVVTAVGGTALGTYVLTRRTRTAEPAAEMAEAV